MMFVDKIVNKRSYKIILCQCRNLQKNQFNDFQVRTEFKTIILRMAFSNTILYYFLSIFPFYLFPLGYPRAPKCSSISLPPVPARVLEENRQITRQINRHVKLWQLNMVPSIPKVAQHSTNLSLALLDLSTVVVKRICPDRFTPHRDLIDGAMSIFSFLHDNSGDIRYFWDHVNPSMYDRIAPALIRCQGTTFPEDYYFSEEGNGCPEMASTIRQVCRISREYDLDTGKCQKLKLRPDRLEESECFQNTNLIIDVIWIIVEIVHAACFKEFQKRDDLSAFHMWEQALEGLFTRKIRKYWYQAPLTTEMYQAILHPNFRQQIFNLEMCLEGINQLTPNKMPRLQRPPYPLLMYGKRRRKRSNKVDYNLTRLFFEKQRV